MAADANKYLLLNGLVIKVNPNEATFSNIKYLSYTYMSVVN
jgi:hypothetical protein